MGQQCLECHWCLELSRPPSQNLAKVATFMPQSMAVLKIFPPGTQTGVTVYMGGSTPESSQIFSEHWKHSDVIHFFPLPFYMGETNRSLQDPWSGYYSNRDSVSKEIKRLGSEVEDPLGQQKAQYCQFRCGFR